MNLWGFWFIGIVITIGTRIAIQRLTKNGWHYDVSNPVLLVIMSLLVIICIVLVGGITIGEFLGTVCAGAESIWEYIIVGMFPAGFMYVLLYQVLNIEDAFDNVFFDICFLVVFIISIIGWTIPISNYNWNYEQNVETITETNITSTQERKLLYFCNIPVQEISGNVSGSSFLGNGSISGSISTSDELSYWYVNEKNEGIYGSVTASSSKIVFISDEEKPYLEIISYCTYTKTIDHNNGEEYTTTDREWKEYIFYLPETIMQYSLD